MESYHKYALFKIPDLGCIQCGSNMSISLACLASESQAIWEFEVFTAAISRGTIGPACAGIFSSPSVYLKWRAAAALDCSANGKRAAEVN